MYGPRWGVSCALLAPSLDSGDPSAKTPPTDGSTTKQNAPVIAIVFPVVHIPLPLVPISHPIHALQRPSPTLQHLSSSRSTTRALSCSLSSFPHPFHPPFSVAAPPTMDALIPFTTSGSLVDLVDSACHGTCAEADYPQRRSLSSCETVASSLVFSVATTSLVSSATGSAPLHELHSLIPSSQLPP